MNKYKRILFESQHPFIIAQIIDNKLTINETNINVNNNINIDLEDIKINEEIKGFVNSTRINCSNNINLEYKGIKYNLKVTKIDDNEAIIWIKEQENIEDTTKINFLSNLIHEFKTPLNLIFSSTQLINRKIDKDKTISEKDMTRYIKIINQNSYRILKLINNISDDNKINLGHSCYEPVNGNIVYFIEGICDSIESFVKSNNMNIIFDTDEEELIVSFDLDKMERIILNLISNAIKFRKSNDGQIAISITHDKEFINISVRDNGIGISSENIDKIFDKYVRLNDERSIIKEGSGIGLSLVQALVKLHSGSINVDSEIGQWTEFNIKIPNKALDSHQDVIKQNDCLERVEKIKIEFSDIYA